MSKKIIVTIGREYGSGGHEIGVHLAKHFNIPLYDKELIELTAKDGNMAENFLKRYDETHPRFEFPVLTGNTMSPYYQQSFSDKAFLEQSKMIKKLASCGSGVFVGRCADYVLSEFEKVNIFIYGNKGKRIERKLKLLKENENKVMSFSEMSKHIKNVDKKRAQYYEYYTDRKWGKVRNYDLCINTDYISIEGACKTIVEYINSINS